MLIGRYPALLDANVLHSAFLRGALLWFADERLFQPVWSADILSEMRRSVQRRFPDVTDEKADLIESIMKEQFPSAEVTGYSRIIEVHEKDRHVLAAAIVGKCSGIITANTKHFPAEVVAPYQIEVVHPDEFIVNIIDLCQDRAWRHAAATEARCGRVYRTLPHSWLDMRNAGLSRLTRD